MIDAIQAISVVLILGTTILIAKLLAPYLVRVYNRAPSRLDKVLNPIENFIYKICSIDPEHPMGWKQYFLAGLLLNVAQMVIAFLILVFQDKLPLNPLGFQGLSWDLAFHTVVSFATNTNLQHYSGEATLSIFSQMTAIQFLQWISAATGMCMGIAFTRGFIAGSKNVGNFYVDFVRTITRILLPLCTIASVVFVVMGVPQTLNASTAVTTLQGTTQSILVGPVASLDSIMQLGTNGGGFYGTNAAYPFMNPSSYSNIFMISLMLLLPTALIFVFGELLGKKREARPLLWGAYILFGINLAIAFFPNIPLVAVSIETRFGGFMSNLYTITTTAATTGSVNSALSGMHPLVITSGLMGMFIQSIPGGKGVGLMYMVMYIIITVFIVGLMSGRTPEYLGIKITGRDVKLVMVAFLIHPIIILIPTVMAYASGAVAAIGGSGNSVGYTQILWEFTSAAANNGSDFLGASANTPFFNIATGIVMFIGRYAPIAILLALSGSMIGRKRGDTIGLKTDNAIFTIVLIGSIIILVVLTFFPFLALGPISSFFRGLQNGF
ncbi:MAG TPA: potassium-transporting ATPase subunit KdpA [Candidatus Krumholzibacteriaceae bacterium]|nr:potassium-transporting ATPase subunit KdpA [Candidatus Krumholzibacteriaceae bacterium]